MIHPLAEADMAEAVAFYEDRAPGLGGDFLAEAWRAFERIENGPDAWPILDGRVRRCLMERFPFGVYYRVDPTGIVVLSVMHTRRRPNAWRSGRTGQ